MRDGRTNDRYAVAVSGLADIHLRPRGIAQGSSPA